MTKSEKIQDRKRKKYAIAITLVIHIVLLGGIALQSSDSFNDFFPSLFSPENIDVDAPRA